VSFAAKTFAAPSSDTRLRATLAGFDSVGNFVDDFFTEFVNPPTSGYEPYSFEFTVPDGVAAVNLGFRVFDATLNAPTTGGYLIDDVSLLGVPDAVPGDFDLDLDVDGHDFLVWQRGGSPTPLSEVDLATWKANFGHTASGGANVAVPEPSAARLGLVAAGLVAGCTRCPRRRVVLCDWSA
jgi:hypothetical protein